MSGESQGSAWSRRVAPHLNHHQPMSDVHTCSNTHLKPLPEESALENQANRARPPLFIGTHHVLQSTNAAQSTTYPAKPHLPPPNQRHAHTHTRTRLLSGDCCRFPLNGSCRYTSSRCHQRRCNTIKRGPYALIWVQLFATMK